MKTQEIIQKQRDFFNTKKTFDISFRIKILNQLKFLIKKYQNELVEAFKTDFNKCEFDVLSTEFNLVIEEIEYMIKSINKLTEVKRVKTSIVNFPSKGYIYKEPYGVVLIIGPWNYPFLLTMQPLVGAIASGNCVICKPSENSCNVSKVIKKIIDELKFDELVYVIEGDKSVAIELLEERFDYIFFTGGEKVGQIVLEKASKYLTPVTLELGGKSPCIVDKDADLEIASRRIVWGKYINAGQTCVAPDYVCVHRSIHDKFLEKVIDKIKSFYYEDNKLSINFPYIINNAHLQRLLRLIDYNKVVFGGNHYDLIIEPTVLDMVSFNDEVMKEEIFGPIMPIIVYDDLDELLKIIEKKEKPLAFYYFSNDLKKAKELIKTISFGGGCINDTIMHLTNPNLPFGGVGKSGMGSYHGKKTFDTFTHEKSVMIKSKSELKLKYPPYTSEKLRLLKKFFRCK